MLSFLLVIALLGLCSAQNHDHVSPATPPTNLPASPAISPTPRKCAKEGGKARVAIGFFGISRCLDRTIHTFDNNVFKVLDEANITYDVFWSTMAAVEEVKSRNNAATFGPTNPYEVSLMNPCQLSMQDQEQVVHREFNMFLKHYNITYYSPTGKSLEKDDRLSDNFASIRNILCAYHSEHILAEMISAHELTHNFQYDAVVAIRPDTALMRPIDLPQNIDRIRNESRHTLWVPDFQPWGGYNDCFAYGSREVMSTYFRRGKSFLEGNNPGVFAEVHIKKMVADHHYKVEYSTMRLLRVRANGHVSDPFDWMNRDTTNSSPAVTEAEYRRCVPLDGGGKLSPNC